MSGNGSTAGTRVELYARTSLPEVAARRRDEIAGRLERLASEGHVSGVEIHTWDKKVPLAERSREREIYEDFRDWARETNVELAPFFDTRECYSMTTGQRGEWLVLPAICLVVHRDDAVDSVYPHSTNEGSRSVMDCLRALESARTRIDTDPGTEREADDDRPVIEASE